MASLGNVVAAANEVVEEVRTEAAANTAAVVADAVDAINDAQETAEAIAQAAMETELGRRISAAETRGMEWQSQLDSLRADLLSLREQVMNLLTAATATATLQVADMITEQPSLTPPASAPTQETLAEATEEVTSILPESLGNAVEGSPAPPIVPLPAKRHRFL